MEISQYSHENTWARVSFLIKLQTSEFSKPRGGIMVDAEQKFFVNWTCPDHWKLLSQTLSNIFLSSFATSNWWVWIFCVHSEMCTKNIFKSLLPLRLSRCLPSMISYDCSRCFAEKKLEKKMEIWLVMTDSTRLFSKVQPYGITFQITLGKQSL